MAELERQSKSYTFQTSSGGVGTDITKLTPIAVEPNAKLSVHVIVDNGTTGVAPTDNPSGTLHLYATGGKTNTSPFHEVTLAASDLAAVSPKGDNALIGSWAIFENCPGSAIKIGYTYTSGGGTGSRVLVTVDLS